MLEWNVLQYRWLINAVLGALALVLAVVLAYMAIWQQRYDPAARVEQAAGQQTRLAWISSFLPWVLILTYLGSLIYGIIYTAARAVYPPNW